MESINRFYHFEKEYILRELIGQVTFYENRSIMGVDSVAAETGRAEDAIDFFATKKPVAHSVTPAKEIPEGSTSDIHFLIDPPASPKELKEFEEYCHATWDDIRLGMLNSPLDRSQAALSSLAIHS